VGKLNKREASYPGKINVRIMDFILGLEKSDFLQGKISYAGSTVLNINYGRILAISYTPNQTFNILQNQNLT
jgi:hypothetical protein